LTEADTSFKRIEEPFLIGEYGGWAIAKREIIDGIWRDRVLEELAR
jgi:hypothetical protein